MDEERKKDLEAIAALLARQFASLCWGPDRPADWTAFARDFLDDARLYPAARPLKPQTVAGFLARMQGLAAATMRAFDEELLGTDIRLFGNVAVALAGCRIVENGTTVGRGVEALLLVKIEHGWHIAAQAWDGERPEAPLPAELAGGGG